MTFAWNTTHYPTRQAYADALRPFAVPSWIKGVTLHHTYTPTQAEWRGARSMEAMRRYYQALGWPSGPHLFLAPDGLWAGTPLSHAGTHAGKCNVTAIGLEVVGRFDREGWDIGLSARVYALIILLLHWAGLDERVVAGHRECGSPKSCPGRAIDMAAVRHALHERIFDRRFVITVPAARVRSAPRANAAIVRSVTRGTTLPGHVVRGMTYQGSDRWARVKLPSSVTGYIWGGLGRWEAR